MRIGSASETEREAPERSKSGATTQTSSLRVRAIRSMTARPGAWMPSSLAMRIRCFKDLPPKSTARSRVGCPGGACRGAPES
jgi:hypothetical protein